MKIAVTGAFSYSGKYITRRLLDRGEQVITLTNHPDRVDPFEGQVMAYPLNFKNPEELERNLQGSEVLVNTYWIRFDRNQITQPLAVENTRVLIHAAAKAGVNRVVHISITNPSSDSPLPYFWGKAANEQIVANSGMSYAILRPTVLFGREDILINNIAWLLRRFPVFGMPGNGTYRLSPVYVDDLACLAVDAVYLGENLTWDIVGPDEFTFHDLVKLIGNTINARRALIPIPPRLALIASQVIGLFMKDVLLTPEEVNGLMSNLLISSEPPRGTTRLEDWLMKNRETIGKEYASEILRHF